jgi:hypothetical protein
MVDNRDFHETDNILDSYVCSVLSWEFAAQAFLFGAAATLTSVKIGRPQVPDTCVYNQAWKQGACTLLLWIPIIGMLVAAMSTLMSIHTALQNCTQRHTALELYKAKLRACKFLAGPKSLPSLDKNLRTNAEIARFGELAAVALHCMIFFVWFTFLAGRRRGPSYYLLEEVAFHLNVNDDYLL